MRFDQVLTPEKNDSLSLVKYARTGYLLYVRDATGRLWYLGAFDIEEEKYAPPKEPYEV